MVEKSHGPPMTFLIFYVLSLTKNHMVPAMIFLILHTFFDKKSYGPPMTFLILRTFLTKNHMVPL